MTFLRPITASWPGLTRPSRDRTRPLCLPVDGRVKPGNDGMGEAVETGLLA
jgi:hypothetical protein